MEFCLDLCLTLSCVLCTYLWSQSIEGEPILGTLVDMSSLVDRGPSQIWEESTVDIEEPGHESVGTGWVRMPQAPI